MNNTIQLSGRVRLAMEGPNVYNTLVNDFPSYKECVSNVPSLAKSMAWHRDWCVTKEGELHYKTEGVGLINSDNGEPNLNDNFWYLREALNDSRKMVV